MKITITKSEEEFDITAAWRIIGQMLEKHDAMIGLSTGQTTINMHQVVSSVYTKYPFDTSGITLFNVDELTNVPAHYPGTCYNRIKHQIADPLGISSENFIMPPTLSDDFERESNEFQERITAKGITDLQMLGIGLNGHIGINQPGTPFESETWVSRLEPGFEEELRKEAGIPPDVVLSGITLGIKNIMQSKKLILLAKGKHKAAIIKQAITGPVSTAVPASVLQLHPNCEVLLDADAGAYFAGYIDKGQVISNFY